MALEAPRKLRFKRAAVAIPEKEIQDESLIQKNLEQLKANVEKKKRAQEAYYENNSSRLHISPMSRDYTRRPVKLRLGRRIPFNGTNTSAIPPKQRLLRIKRTGTMNNSINARKTRITRLSAQQKLNQIRARQQNTSMEAPGGPRRIKLKRPLVNSFSNGLVNSTPRNLQVQVRNNSIYQDKSYLHQGNPHRFRQILNPDIQMEIRRIQIDFQGSNTITPMLVKPTSTKISTSVRFGALQ